MSVLENIELNSGKGMIIDGVCASEAIDSSGEKLSIKGLNIDAMNDPFIGCSINYRTQGCQAY